jgi:hypothetical protein
VSTLVRFKNDEVCPCPNADDELCAAAWAAIRGKPVRIGDPVPEALVDPENICGSDTYWSVLDQELLSKTAQILLEPEDQPAVACRHVLEIGE